MRVVLSGILTGILLAASSLAASSLAASGPGAQAPAVRIPPAHGTALSGDKVDLPEALKGKVGVLVLGFSRGTGDSVAGWGKRLAAEYRTSNSVIYYEIPVLQAVPAMLRGFVTRKIGESVPDVAKDRFVVVTDHEKEWKAAAGFNGADDAYVIVVDSEGIVRLRVQGAVSESSFAEVKRQIEAAR